MTAETAPRPVRTPGVRQRMVRYWIVLATVRHILQDRRFQETVIVSAIGVVALAQVGRDNQARPVRRAIAWYDVQSQAHDVKVLRRGRRALRSGAAGRP